MKRNGPLTQIDGVGSELATKFARQGLKTVSDLIEHYPRRYEDFSIVTAIKRLKPGLVTIRAEIIQVGGQYRRRGMHITEAVASDSTGSVRLIWFNQPYRERSLRLHEPYYISGKFALSHQRLSIMSPNVELVSDIPVNTARILPIYRETKGLTSKQVRRIMRKLSGIISQTKETLPQWLIEACTLMPRNQALATLHFPQSSKELTTAKQRFEFEETFTLMLANQLNKRDIAQEIGHPIAFNESLAKQFVAHLNFQLTDSQRRVIWQICKDMARVQPMNRLVEGDVGSGKTVVAAMAAVFVLNSGYQVAMMAPTELLARQHADTVYKLLQPLGLASQVGLLIGAMTATQKKQVHLKLANREINFIIGTHALLQESVKLAKLALVIIDEQHRFGVAQRKTLLQKAGYMPHVLSLTATPIPRSLALTLYGELDASTLPEKPAFRKPVITKLISPNSTTSMFQTVISQLLAGRQAFVVVPTIFENTTSDVKSVEEVWKSLRTKELKSFRIGLLHGQLPSRNKAQVMKDFVAHKLDVLVSTTVIEVGVDVPNASVMIIENADHFGLAQVHQLRGRVGRSEYQGYCYLVASSSQAVPPRLRMLETTNDGFALAEIDLELRGPGAIYGTLQHGKLPLQFATLDNQTLLHNAKRMAQEFIERKENLLHYKQLQEQVTRVRAVTNLN